MLPEVDKNVGPDVSIDLRNARQLLEAKDAILEPGLMATVVDFVSSGGDGGEVPLLLARGLVGYPQMTRLLCDWLVIAGVPEPQTPAGRTGSSLREVPPAPPRAELSHAMLPRTASNFFFAYLNQHACINTRV